MSTKKKSVLPCPYLRKFKTCRPARLDTVLLVSILYLLHLVSLHPYFPYIGHTQKTFHFLWISQINKEVWCSKYLITIMAKAQSCQNRGLNQIVPGANILYISLYCYFPARYQP